MRAWFIVAFARRRPGLSNLRVLVNPAVLGTILNNHLPRTDEHGANLGPGLALWINVLAEKEVLALCQCSFQPGPDEVHGPSTAVLRSAQYWPGRLLLIFKYSHAVDTNISKLCHHLFENAYTMLLRRSSSYRFDWRSRRKLCARGAWVGDPMCLSGAVWRRG
jgi:hypothetical protein